MVNRIVGYMLAGETPVPVYSQRYQDCRRFAEWLRDPRNREMECTPINAGLFVVTSFLGINRARYPSKELLLWESRVIRCGRQVSSHLYSSAAEARRGHWAIVCQLFLQECGSIPPPVREQIDQQVGLPNDNEMSEEATSPSLRPRHLVNS